MTDPRQVFVVGCYRSGTTLVERIVGCHPDATGLGFETLLLTHVVPRRPLPAFNARLWEETLDRRLGVRTWEQLHPDRREAFDVIARRVAQERGASVFVEKTPFHLFHVERILARDPDARVLHVLRGGRDVVTSILAGGYPLGRWRPRRVRLLAAAALWELFAWEGHRLGRLGSERVHTLHYEDVVRAPRAALDAIARFLGAGRSAATLAQWLDRAQGIGSNSSFAPIRGISDRPVSRWLDPDRLPPADARLVDGLLAPTLALAGYAPAGGAAGSTGPGWAAARAGMPLVALARVARYRANTGAAPPPHLWRYLRQSAGRR